MFNSIYSDKKRFDAYLEAHIFSPGQITESFVNGWIGTIKGKSSSVGNEVITIRQVLKFLALSG